MRLQEDSAREEHGDGSSSGDGSSQGLNERKLQLLHRLTLGDRAAGESPCLITLLEVEADGRLGQVVFQNSLSIAQHGDQVSAAGNSGDHAGAGSCGTFLRAVFGLEDETVLKAMLRESLGPGAEEGRVDVEALVEHLTKRGTCNGNLSPSEPIASAHHQSRFGSWRRVIGVKVPDAVQNPASQSSPSGHTTGVGCGGRMLPGAWRICSSESHPPHGLELASSYDLSAILHSHSVTHIHTNSHSITHILT